jgi:hypothetical protein
MNDLVTDSMANTMAHELNETMTDPFLNAWYRNGTGDEVGDLCSWNFGAWKNYLGVNFNIQLGSHYYLLQQNYFGTNRSGNTYTNGFCSM